MDIEPFFALIQPGEGRPLGAKWSRAKVTCEARDIELAARLAIAWRTAGIDWEPLSLEIASSLTDNLSFRIEGRNGRSLQLVSRFRLERLRSEAAPAFFEHLARRLAREAEACVMED